MSNQENPPELDSRPQSRREWSGRIRSVVLPVGLVVVIVAGLLYLQSGSSGGDDDGFGTVELPAARNITMEGPAARAERAAPDFLLRQLGGDPVRLSDLQGQPVVVNFWATWCSSCRVETPDLINLYEQHQSAGLVMLGVNLRENEGSIGDFVADFGVPYPIVLDRSGEVANTWQIGGPFGGIPATYFIDATGVVRKVVYGLVTEALATEGLSLILPAKGG